MLIYVTPRTMQNGKVQYDIERLSASQITNEVRRVFMKSAGSKKDVQRFVKDNSAQVLNYY